MKRAHEFISYLFETAVSDEYEKKVINALKKAGHPGVITSPAGSSATAPDSDFIVSYGNKGPHIMEIKLDWGAQLGGGSWTLTEVDGRIKYTWTGKVSKKDIESDEELKSSTAAMKKALAKWLGANGALAKWRNYVQKVRRGHKLKVKKGGKVYVLTETATGEDINKNGNGFSCSKFAWEAAKQKRLLEKLNANIESSVRFMEKHYEAKGAFYIQIGGDNGGFYRFGDDSSAANFKQYVPDVPEFGRGESFAPIPFKIEMRATRGGAKGEKTALSIRAQGRQKVAKGSFVGSPYRMDDVSSIKELMTTYNNNFLAATEKPKKLKKGKSSINEQDLDLAYNLVGGGSGRSIADMPPSADLEASSRTFPSLYDMPANLMAVKPEELFQLVESKIGYEYDIGGFSSTTEDLKDDDYDYEIVNDDQEPETTTPEAEEAQSWNLGGDAIGMSEERYQELVNVGYTFEEIESDEESTPAAAIVKESKLSLMSILF